MERNRCRKKDSENYKKKNRGRKMEKFRKVQREILIERQKERWRQIGIEMQMQTEDGEKQRQRERQREKIIEKKMDRCREAQRGRLKKRWR